MKTPEDSLPQPPGTGGIIFAVDDDETDRSFFLRALGATMLPLSCRQFCSGAALLDALLDVMRGAPPPLACFVDVKMAGMSGLDVLRWIRAQNALREIPIVMLSSSEDPQNLAEALQFGAQCYTAKFPPAEQLREIIEAAERYAAAATASPTFHLPCNLLTASHQAMA